MRRTQHSGKAVLDGGLDLCYGLVSAAKPVDGPRFSNEVTFGSHAGEVNEGVVLQICPLPACVPCCGQLQKARVMTHACALSPLSQRPGHHTRLVRKTLCFSRSTQRQASVLGWFVKR